MIVSLQQNCDHWLHSQPLVHTFLPRTVFTLVTVSGSDSTATASTTSAKITKMPFAFIFIFFGGVLDKEANLSFWVFLGCVCFFLVMLWLWCEGRSKRKRRGLDRRSFSFEKGWGQRVVKWGASLRNGRWIGREGVRGLSGNRLDLWGWDIGSYTAEISHRHSTNKSQFNFT